jgi:branched-chain amino acid transport system permease protein
VAQDQQALRLMAPTRQDQAHRLRPVLRHRGAGRRGLIIIQPVEPSIGREYIGRIFAICVLGGLGSFPAW